MVGQRLLVVARRLMQKARDWFVFFQRGSQIQIQTQIREDLRLIEEHVAALWLTTYSQNGRGGPLANCGRKYFSQSDEDGITLEIFRRIDLRRGASVEIGCGDGLENNSLILAAQGWKTLWIDGRQLAFNADCSPHSFVHRRSFVTAENIVETILEGLGKLEIDSFDFLSVDIDGNDGYLVSELLQYGFRPSLAVIETNNVMPPPIRYHQEYVPTHIWQGLNSEYGISLQSAADLFSRFGYQCVAVNRQTGINAFFVRKDHSEFFSDVPTDLKELYVGPSIRPFDHKYRKSKLTPGLAEQMIRSNGSVI